MSFIKKILGTRSFAEHKQDGDRLFEAGDYGGARLAYEKARDRKKEASQAQLEEIDGRIQQCRDALALSRLKEAADLIKQGKVELAMVEIKNATEIGASEAIVSQAEQLADEAEREVAREGVEEPAAPSDEDAFAAIAGSWEDEQDEEYESYGDDFRNALLRLYEGNAGQARPVLEKLLEQAKDPHYLYYEVGRARLLDSDEQGAAEALRRFLASIGPDEGGEARLSAHVELGRLAKGAGDFEGAVAQLQAALEATPQDPRPYLVMGNFLRQEGHAEQAVEVLQSGIEVMGETHPDWRLYQEMGLAYADAGNSTQAIEKLERVVDLLSARGNLDLPVETATLLASLQEKAGKLGRAADLYSALAQGSDRANHFRYYSEAGRLLAEMGLRDDARRMLTRASEIAPEDEQVRQRLKARLDELSS